MSSPLNSGWLLADRGEGVPGAARHLPASEEHVGDVPQVVDVDRRITL